MISGECFVYYGPEQWDSMWRNRHHLLSRLAAANRAVYLEPRPYTYEVSGGLRRGELALRDVGSHGVTAASDNLWVYRWPRYAPVGGPLPLRVLTRLLRRADLKRALRGLGLHDPIVWLSHPSQADARFDLPARLRVYHIVDDYLSYYGVSPEHRASLAERENILIDWADLVVTVSQELIETKGAGNPKFRLLPNAVDDAAYRRPSLGDVPALARVPRPILGYVGLISVRLDLALLNALAAARPDWTLVMMGTMYRDGCAEEIDRLAARPNVLLLRAVPGHRVADYVRMFDVGLVPYRVTRETRHASPLKIYEYLAAGLPVVGTELPGVRQFAEVVTTASTTEEWEAAIAAALLPVSPEAIAARRRAVATHTWDARVETLSQYLQEALALKTTA